MFPLFQAKWKANYFLVICLVSGDFNIGIGEIALQNKLFMKIMLFISAVAA